MLFPIEDGVEVIFPFVVNDIVYSGVSFSTSASSGVDFVERVGRED